MSEPEQPIVYKRRAFTRDDGKGNSTAYWTLTPASQTDPVQIIAEPICTVPIIFVPGIMGSNLMASRDIRDIKKKGKSVWLVDSRSSVARGWLGRSAELRQQLLNPDTTDVFSDGAVPDDVPTIGDATAIRKRRHWGEVSAKSYQGFLVWLQATLNERKRTTWWRAELGQRPYAANALPGTAFQPLNEAAVRHAASIRYPVYACGYNWLQSNGESAKRLAQRIKDVIRANNSDSYTCEKVILVTHSMGGLVARACSELEGLRGQIAGIVHGVMPTTGSPAAYKRVRAGTDGAVGYVLGEDAARVTAVFANSPGALQLLPTKAYPPGWLRLGNGLGNQFLPVVSLPKADPYEEIYSQRGKWWSLVREELIDPAKLPDHGGWKSYQKNLDKARAFHDQLANRYHPNTYSFHGDGLDKENGRTWGRVSWGAQHVIDIARRDRLENPARVYAEPRLTAADLLALRVSNDDGQGRLEFVSGGQAVDFQISEGDSPGDGTVPVASGAAAAHFGGKTAYHVNLDDEGHEGAYDNPTARALTLHAILSIAQTVEIKE